MDISKISSNAINHLQELGNNIQRKAINLDYGQDTFVKSPESIIAKAVEEAKAFCMESVLKGNPKESSVAIDEFGKVLYKNEGEERSCGILLEKLKPNTTIVHSHPGEDLHPLSPGDIINFLRIPEIKTVIAVDKLGQSCSMTKGKDFIQEHIPPNIEKFVHADFQKEWANHFGIDYSDMNKYLEYYEKLLAQRVGIDDPSKIYEQLLGIQKPKNPKDALGVLEFQCMMNGIHFGSPQELAFKECLDKIGEIQYTQEGIDIIRSFNEKIAKKYNAIYQYK